MGMGAGILWEWGRKNQSEGAMGLGGCWWGNGEQRRIGGRRRSKKSVGLGGDEVLCRDMVGGDGFLVSGFCAGKGWVTDEKKERRGYGFLGSV
ncbi:hypothetical protein Pyn_16704 [Prunus yedoensis var. nudiflora]|uniref:Uncharacterized protein n=1 Tax=Prunus yedoensis var. nudiflora TaxID=2094558 RepID=A0A314ZDL8_PRUYE|nr:hypothetical protein Pyn_16704 [Prunus yedoensis var. nudiflora]